MGWRFTAECRWLPRFCDITRNKSGQTNPGARPPLHRACGGIGFSYTNHILINIYIYISTKLVESSTALEVVVSAGWLRSVNHGGQSVFQQSYRIFHCWRFCAERNEICWLVCIIMRGKNSCSNPHLHWLFAAIFQFGNVKQWTTMLFRQCDFFQISLPLLCACVMVCACSSG